MDEVDTERYESALDEENTTSKNVIKNAAKFMKMLYGFIQDEAPQYNTETRRTYRGTFKSVLSNIEVGQTFRASNWLCTSEDIDVAFSFADAYGDEKYMIEYTVVSNTNRCGKLNHIGSSKFPGERETLFLPYTAFKLVSKTDTYAKLKLVDDDVDDLASMNNKCGVS